MIKQIVTIIAVSFALTACCPLCVVKDEEPGKAKTVKQEKKVDNSKGAQRFGDFD